MKNIVLYLLKPSRNEGCTTCRAFQGRCNVFSISADRRKVVIIEYGFTYRCHIYVNKVVLTVESVVENERHFSCEAVNYALHSGSNV